MSARKLWIAIFLLFFTAFAWADPFSDLMDLVKKQQYASAYLLAKQMEDTYAGDPQYDFLFGLAALESRHPDDAVFALERVIMTEPNNLRARLELARALYLSGDLKAARDEFAKVKKAPNIPAPVNKNIDMFLSAIDKHQTYGSDVAKSYGLVELKTGYDSNINSATTTDIINVPLGLIQLDEASKQIDSSYENASVKLFTSRPINQNFSLFAATDVNDTVYNADGEFSYKIYSLRSGINFRYGQNNFRFPVEIQKINLANEPYRHSLSMAAEWMHVFSEQNSSILFVERDFLLYNQEVDQVLDLELTLAGGGWIHYWTQKLRTISRFYLGDGSPKRSAFISESPGTYTAIPNYNGRNLWGFQETIEWLATEKALLYMNYIYQRSNYNAPNPIFSDTREDQYSELNGGLNYQFTPGWEWLAEGKFIHNYSNEVLYKYNRYVIYAGIRHRFDL